MVLICKNYVFKSREKYAYLKATRKVLVERKVIEGRLVKWLQLELRMASNGLAQILDLPVPN